MLNTRRAFMSLATLVLLGGAATILASQQPGPGQSQQPAVAQGELLSVDAGAKTLSIRTAEKNEMQFHYTDRTEVTGAKEGAAGLGTMKGAQVAVHFTREGQANVATKIEVRAKQ